MEGGAGETLQTERASATPNAPVLRIVPTKRRREAAADLSVAAMQRWFFDAITHPGTIEQGVRAAGIPYRRVVTDGPALDAVDRMRIYHYAYRARLVECLADDFATVRYALGPERFERLAGAVIVASPPRGPNLNGYGRVLVDYLRGSAGRVANRGFCADLAALEWALVEAVHAAPETNLDLAALQAIPADRWGQVRFTPAPSLRVLGFAYPVNRFLQAYREDRAPGVTRRSPSVTAVWRRGFVVWRMDQDLATLPLLNALIAGEPLGEALAPLDGVVDPATVMRWFTAWVSHGFFAEIREG
jgi:hypothetical protein